MHTSEGCCRTNIILVDFPGFSASQLALRAAHGQGTTEPSHGTFIGRTRRKMREFVKSRSALTIVPLVQPDTLVPNANQGASDSPSPA
ncbi:hypothetical protein BO78DRAFT_396030, partial [Aspergillus sclerotiicarbonarius CBS 121057]